MVDGSKGFGGTLAAPIWAAFMSKALAGQAETRVRHVGRDRATTPSKFDIPVS